MRRREFIALLGGAASAAATAFAQTKPALVAVLLQGGAYRVGFEGVREGLEAAGLQEGSSFQLVLREGKGDLAAIRAFARELEREGADVLVAFATSVALATKQATMRVPIVFVAGSDPVKYGLVDSIAKPGGRVTGISGFRSESNAKRFALLREVMPGLRRTVLFHNPRAPAAEVQIADARQAARALNIDLIERQILSPSDVRRELSALREGEADAFFISNEAIVLSQAEAIIERATELRMAVMAQNMGLVAQGALAGYGLDYREDGRAAAKYVVRILAGTSPSELPVEVNERHRLGINLRAAKSLGVEIPPTLLARADEVIE